MSVLPFRNPVHPQQPEIDRINSVTSITVMGEQVPVTPDQDRLRVNQNDIGKLIRKVLAKRFSGVKFSVKGQRYAGGSSIDITWVDGPTVGMVDAIVDGFKGASFDGMTDSMNYLTRMVDGYKVRWSTDFIHGYRVLSPAFSEWIDSRLSMKYADIAEDIDARAERNRAFQSGDGMVRGFLK